MAQLGSYYGLCPLIDSKNLLGISEDVEKGVVIVTLGKNIACRYKLSDQKQISSWKTKEKFSSPVIYDSKYSQYLAVFNQLCIKFWSKDEENLDKLKKYKFSKQIYTLISDGNDTLVFFQDGAFCTLTDAIEMRKNLNLEPVVLDSEEIVDILYKKVRDDFYVGIIVRSSNEFNLYWTKHNLSSKLSKLKLFRDGYMLQGYVFYVDGAIVNLLSLWSDGRIFSHPLETDDRISDSELFARVECVSTKHSVSMVSLDEYYVAMFGANCNEEGAMLAIYNTQFKVTQSTQPFKLFTEGAKLQCIEGNLFLPVGQNLAVIPFKLETEQLAALVGSHKTEQPEKDADVAIVQEFEVASWNTKSNIKAARAPSELSFSITERTKQGLPESVIVGEILPDIFKQHDIDALSLIINYFSDIPEKYLAKVLKCVLTEESTFFSDSEQSMSESVPSDLQPVARTKLLDMILCKPFSEISLVSYLRSELTLNEVLSLINYVCFLWSDEGHVLPSFNSLKSEAQLIKWTYVLIDSSYQKFLLSKDERVGETLNRLLRLTTENLQFVDDLKLVSNILSEYKNRKYKVASNVGLKYSIEQINLY
ncbi:hypothetical protein NQ318_004773 [Aromia moschata]|uniref:Nucleolar protein 11 n=1 Tax=Aromia moschata TaxID=1265417 RepID=A0AAV8XS51_9CUCU|nr:hypothetical protein NQ318_004773 [Aromia moschata]